MAAPAVVRRGEGPKAGSGRLVGRQGRLLGVQIGEKGAESVVSRVASERRCKRWLAALLGTREGLGSALYRPGRRGRSCLGRAVWGRVARGSSVRGTAAAGHGNRRGEQRMRRGACRARVLPGKAGFKQTRGAGLVLGGGATRGRPGGRRRRTDAVVGAVQGDGGGRNGQWQFRN